MARTGHLRRTHRECQLLREASKRFEKRPSWFVRRFVSSAGLGNKRKGVGAGGDSFYVNATMIAVDGRGMGDVFSGSIAVNGGNLTIVFSSIADIHWELNYLPCLGAGDYWLPVSRRLVIQSHSPRMVHMNPRPGQRRIALHRLFDEIYAETLHHASCSACIRLPLATVPALVEVHFR